jgi:hypothetical protein
MVQELVKCAVTSTREEDPGRHDFAQRQSKVPAPSSSTPYCVWIITFTINPTIIFRARLSHSSLTSLTDPLLMLAMLLKTGNRLITAWAYRLGRGRVTNVRPLPCGYVRVGRSQLLKGGQDAMRLPPGCTRQCTLLPFRRHHCRRTSSYAYSCLNHTARDLMPNRPFLITSLRMSRTIDRH